MKKYTVALMLTLMGMAGCKNSDTAEVNSTQTVIDSIQTVKPRIDTALVLGRLYSSDSRVDYNRFLLVNKEGKVIRTLNMTKIGDCDFSNVGDTVIVATDMYENANIIKNLTMENKIKAFSKQR